MLISAKGHIYQQHWRIDEVEKEHIYMHDGFNYPELIRRHVTTMD